MNQLHMIRIDQQALETDNDEAHARYDVHLTGDRKIQLVQGAIRATFEAGNMELEAAGHVKVHHGGMTILIDEAGKVSRRALDMASGGDVQEIGVSSAPAAARALAKVLQGHGSDAAAAALLADADRMERAAEEKAGGANVRG